MSEISGGNPRTWWQKILGYLLDVAFHPGWGRRILVAASLTLFLWALFILRGGKDYREDPSLLAPRTASMYVETRAVDEFFNEVAAWPLWNTKRRYDGQDIWGNKLLGDVAGQLGGKVGGLGTRLPMNWLTKAKRAAFCMDDGDTPGEATWALYLHIETPAGTLAEMAVEPGLVLEMLRETTRGSRDMTLYSLTGNGDGKIYFAILGPWLIVSPHDKLPSFALDGVKKPAHSLGRSEILPDWERGKDLRGMYDPSRVSIFSLPWPGEVIRTWVSSDARQTFLVSVEKDGGVAIRLSGGVVSETIAGGKIWRVLKFIVVILGFLGIFLIAAVLLIIVNWGGWLKIAAVRAGITPADSPAPVSPSHAFLEDSGLAERLEESGMQNSPEKPAHTSEALETSGSDSPHSEPGSSFSPADMPGGNPWDGHP